jgi:citrate lyase subunit beta / citryl-CoA lyase
MNTPTAETASAAVTAIGAPLTPRRSVLYMPGANTRALEKAKGLDADALILDLEDAVAPDSKVEARANVCAAVASGEYGGKELTIRCNSLDTPWGADDLRAAARVGPAAVVIPKVNSVDELARIEQALVDAGAPEHTKIWAMLESPIAVLRAYDICSSSDRLTVLVMGTNDLAKELRCSLAPGRAPLLFGMSACLNAARAAGKVILDGVFNTIDDAEGFMAECRQGAEMGFDGKTLIHPSQLGPCNEAFSPSETEIEHARRVIAAFDEALSSGKGVVQLDGRMIENLHVDNARRILAVADAISAG